MTEKINKITKYYFIQYSSPGEIKDLQICKIKTVTLLLMKSDTY